MDYQRLVQNIENVEMKIQVYKNKINQHKNYFSRLKLNESAGCTFFLILPFLIGMRAGKSHWHVKYKAARYTRLLAVSFISYFQNRAFISIYSHLEELIRNKLAK